jgi:hypothetical protein
MENVSTCKTCKLDLPQRSTKCPMCQRPVRSLRLLIVGGAVAGVLLLLVLLAGSSSFKSRVLSWRFSPEVVVKATQSLVAKSPAVHNPVAFSSPEQTTVEHWDAYRWRVSGFVDSQPEQGGARIRTLYFAVVQNAGSDWRLEDLQLQNIDAPAR